MAKTSKPLETADILIARTLSGEAKRAGVSLRSIAAKTGLSHHRVGTIFREQGPATMGEIYGISGALGITARHVIMAAEELMVPGTIPFSDADYGEIMRLVQLVKALEEPPVQSATPSAAPAKPDYFAMAARRVDYDPAQMDEFMEEQP